MEISRAGSISQAAENLYMGQPNLSKAMKELEESLGITIFKRSPKGVVPTKDGEQLLAMLELHVCIGSSCHLKGSYNVIQTFQQMIEENDLHDQVSMKAQFCMKRCQQGVSVVLEEEPHSVSPETAREFFRNAVLARMPERE